MRKNTMGCQSVSCQGNKKVISELKLIDANGDAYKEAVPINYLSMLGISAVEKPPGGWGGKFALPDGSPLSVAIDSPLKLIKHIAVILSNRGMLEDWEQVLKIVYASYRVRPGFRGNGIFETAEPVRSVSALDLKPVAQTPDLWGGAAWKTWHMTVHLWNEDSELFFSQAKVLQMLINEDVSPDTGCENCSKHFNEFLSAYPIDSVTTQLKAALYSIAAHNNASKDAGKQLITLEQAARMHNWQFIYDLNKAGEISEEVLKSTDYIL